MHIWIPSFFFGLLCAQQQKKHNIGIFDFMRLLILSNAFFSVHLLCSLYSLLQLTAFTSFSFTFTHSPESLSYICFVYYLFFDFSELTGVGSNNISIIASQFARFFLRAIFKVASAIASNSNIIRFCLSILNFLFVAPFVAPRSTP